MKRYQITLNFTAKPNAYSKAAMLSEIRTVLGIEHSFNKAVIAETDMPIEKYIKSEDFSKDIEEYFGEGIFSQYIIQIVDVAYLEPERKGYCVKRASNTPKAEPQEFGIKEQESEMDVDKIFERMNQKLDSVLNDEPKELPNQDDNLAIGLKYLKREFERVAQLEPTKENLAFCEALDAILLNGNKLTKFKAKNAI